MVTARIETIKDVWYAVIVDDKPYSVHPTREQAEDATNPSPLIQIEQVQITITRIKTIKPM